MCHTLREKCPNTEFFLVSIFSYSCIPYLLRRSPYSFQIRENMDQKKLRIWTLHVVIGAICSEKFKWLFLILILQQNFDYLLIN